VASNDSRNIGLAAIALVAFAGLLVWVLITPEPEPKPTPAAEEAAAPEPAQPALPKVAAKAAPTAQPSPSAPKPPPDMDVDLFAGPMPDWMIDLHAMVLGKKWLEVEQEKQLYNYGQEHKDDARPQLILAWESMNREWYGMAVRMYRIAYRADHRAKYDPSMLRDLLWVASRHDRVEFRDSSEIIREAYGEEALPQIDDELNAARAQNDMVRAARLEKLRKEVAGR
jgi:hypothetical protein